MIRGQIDEDVSELIFRIFFSSIFIVLGGEHLLRDELIQQLMPAWLPAKRAVSVASGIVLLLGGTSIALGIFIHWAGTILGLFLITVTLVIHVPGMFVHPESLAEDWVWLWDLYQRSNFIKNICLLGGCFHFLYHEPGRFSLKQVLDERRFGAR